MKTTLSERLYELMHELRITPSEYSRKMGIAKQMVSNWKTNKVPVPDKYIIKTIEIFTEVDANWFIRGENMEQEDETFLNDKRKNIINNNDFISASNSEMEIKYLKDLIKEKDEQIKILKSIIKL